MRKRVPINTDQYALEDAWEYYETVRDTIIRAAQHAKRSALKREMGVDSKYFGMSQEEVDEYFEKMLDETDKQACLFLIASAEAALRVDFFLRVSHRRKDDVSQKFCGIFKNKCDHSKVKVELDQDILATWAEMVPESKSHIGDLRGALRYRHWLAHGRWWVPKLGRRYDPTGILQIIKNLFLDIGLANS